MEKLSDKNQLNNGERQIRDEKGQFVDGHPNLGGGRPKGSVGAITYLKNELIRVALEENAPELFRKLLRNPFKTEKALRLLLSLSGTTKVSVSCDSAGKESVKVVREFSGEG